MVGDVIAAVTLRPDVPMGAYHALGYVCVLGAVEALRLEGADVGIGWPSTIVDAQTSEALAKLVSKGLITYESYGTVTLTPKGKSEAIKVYNTHNILKNFFEAVLGISPEEASENACKIEHIISPNILKRIGDFTSFWQNHSKTYFEQVDK